MVMIRWRGEWRVLGRNQAMKMMLERSEGRDERYYS